MAEAHSSIMHVGFPRRLSYDPSRKPDFTVDVKDNDDVGLIYTAKPNWQRVVVVKC